MNHDFLTVGYVNAVGYFDIGAFGDHAVEDDASGNVAHCYFGRAVAVDVYAIA